MTTQAGAAEYYCRKCGEAFEPRPYQIRDRQYRCLPCRRLYTNQWHSRRVAEGHKFPYSWTAEQKREWEKEYYLRPEVRAQRAAIARRRYRDPAQAEKIVARGAVSAAIQAGKLQQGPCEKCGSRPAEAHHDNYSRPLDVTWLCRPHHREHHRRSE